MKILDIMGTGTNIRKCMNERNMSQQQLANNLGLTPMSVHKWLTGQNMPTVDNLVCLSELFDTSINDIIATKII